MSELIITIPLTGDPDQDSITVDDALWFMACHRRWMRWLS